MGAKIGFGSTTTVFYLGISAGKSGEGWLTWPNKGTETFSGLLEVLNNPPNAGLFWLLSEKRGLGISTVSFLMFGTVFGV